MGPAKGARSDDAVGGSAWSRSAIHPRTDERSAGLVVSRLVASPPYMPSRPPHASATAERVASAADRVVAFWSAQTLAIGAMRSRVYLSKGWPMPVAILEMIPSASILTDRFVSAMAFFNTPPISPARRQLGASCTIINSPMLGFSRELDLISNKPARASNASFLVFQASLRESAMTDV